MFLVASVLGAVGQYLYKEGAQTIGRGLAPWLLNWRILAGVICYLVVTLFFISAFRAGGELTVLYPLYASTFIWALLMGVLLLGESISVAKLLGIVLIIGGMALIARH